VIPLPARVALPPPPGGLPARVALPPPPPAYRPAGEVEVRILLPWLVIDVRPPLLERLRAVLALIEARRR